VSPSPPTWAADVGEMLAVGRAQPVDQLPAPGPLGVISLGPDEHDVVGVRARLIADVTLAVIHAGGQEMASDRGVFVEPVSHLRVDGEEVIQTHHVWVVAVSLPPAGDGHVQVKVVGHHWDAPVAQHLDDPFHAGCLPAVGLDPDEHVELPGRHLDEAADVALRLLNPNDLMAQGFQRCGMVGLAAVRDTEIAVKRNQHGDRALAVDTTKATRFGWPVRGFGMRRYTLSAPFWHRFAVDRHFQPVGVSSAACWIAWMTRSARNSGVRTSRITASAIS